MELVAIGCLNPTAMDEKAGVKHGVSLLGRMMASIVFIRQRH